ncbi:MAG: long-chain fatty acid--CoA ligase, partial [Lapillicoccus sp.]
YGVPGSGAVLHTLNIRLHAEELAYIINHAGDSAIVVDKILWPLFAPVRDRLGDIRILVIDDDGDLPPGTLSYEQVVASATPRDVLPDIDERAAAVMCYTSGTTGRSKGVLYSHRSMVLHALASGLPDCLNLRESDVALAVVPMFHVNAWGLPFACAMLGSSQVMPGPCLDAASIVELLAGERVTFAAGVPTIWHGVLRYLDEHPGMTDTCYRLMVGGSAAPPAMIKAYQDRHDIEIIHGWGMTEMSPVGTLAIPPSAVEKGSDEYWRYRSAQGRLLVGVDGRLMGPDGSEQPWDGESVGELEVRGPWITASYYLNGTENDTDKDEMASKFSDDGWLRTGDVGALTPDGFLILTDRSKDVIKSGGEWISSVDLENALMGHPAVKEASVVGVPDDKWGERPLASVVLADGQSVTPDELSDNLEGKVAHWQVPERWAFIDEVPKTSVGKFDKKVLRKRYADGELDVKQLN